jgi:hypothetical protein
MAHFPYQNESSQSERRRTLENDRKARLTYHEHAQSDPELELGGRFKQLTPTSVTGVGPSPIPQQPSNSPWHHDPVPMEEPLGFSVEDHDPVGEPHELARDAADTPSTAGEFGHHMDVADGEGAAATNEPPVAVRPRSSEG